MSTVSTAAANLDAAISTFNTSLAAYVDACASANATYRAATPNQSNHRLDGCIDHLRGVLGQNGRTAAALGLPLIGAGPTLAQVHAAD